STATTLEYTAGDTLCNGVYFVPEKANGPLPVVMVVHAWDGLNQEVRDKATKLAEAGYIAFAVDVHGGGKTISDIAELLPTLTPYLEDRSLLLQRMQGALAAAKTIPDADPSRIGAMGYCFGGMAVLDLARAGGDELKAVVTFHAGLEGNTLNNPQTLSAKILVLHGEDDPMVPPEAVAAFKQEMTAKKVDWQLHSYSQTVHAFTRPDANDPAFGTVYNRSADRRSWQAMLNFFTELI
ncbi:MAG: dienelactone hydrolase family protein, partial [Halioglobus sp.]|nr:dienelactone hydrolase family protein [Halioglobus sp.]